MRLAIRLVRRNLALIVAVGLMAGLQLTVPSNAAAFHCPYGDECRDRFGDDYGDDCSYSHCNMVWDSGPKVVCVFACNAT